MPIKMYAVSVPVKVTLLVQECDEYEAKSQAVKRALRWAVLANDAENSKEVLAVRCEPDSGKFLSSVEITEVT